jgi:hypothetical protein
MLGDFHFFQESSISVLYASIRALGLIFDFKK